MHVDNLDGSSAAQDAKVGKRDETIMAKDDRVSNLEGRI